MFAVSKCDITSSPNASPFEDKCPNLHDPRVAGNDKAWLWHCESQSRNIDTDANVAHLHHHRLAHLHCASPFGTVLPADVFSDPPVEGEASEAAESKRRDDWAKFCSVVCDEEEASENDNDTNDAKSNESPRRRRLDPRQRLRIALLMRGEAHSDRHRYKTTHALFGEPCAVLQTRAYQLLPDSGDEEIVAEVPLEYARSFPASTVVVREVAFGADSDPSSPYPVSLWFGLDDERDLKECDRAAVDKIHRAKAKKSKSQQRCATAAGAAAAASASGDDENPQEAGIRPPSPRSSSPTQHQHQQRGNDIERRAASLPDRPFRLVRPADRDASALVESVLRHRLDRLRVAAAAALAADGKSSSSDRASEEASLTVREAALRASYEGQRRHWAAVGTFPLGANAPCAGAGGRDSVDESTEAPPARGPYEVPPVDASSSSSSGKGHETARVVWNSFVSTVSFSERSSMNCLHRERVLRPHHVRIV